MIRLDFESFSEIDIKKHGAWVYSEHPSTDPLCFSYEINDTGVKRWRPGMPAPADLLTAISNGTLIEASNDFFEYAIWNNIFHKRYGWPHVPFEQFRDMFAKARAYGLKGELGTLGDITNVPVKKDKVGKRVMMKLARPRKPTKNNPATRWTREMAPDDFEILEDYCDDDTITQGQISARIPELDANEYQIMLLDKKINARGMYCNLEQIDAAITVFEQATQKYTAELQQIIGDVTITASKVKQLTEWLAKTQHCYAPDLSDETVTALLKRDDLTPPARRVIEIREMLAGSAPKKLYAMRARAGSDGRIRDFLSYCGAAGTGRWAGRGIQPQNYPNSGPAVKECLCCGANYWKELPECPECLSSDSKEADWGVKGMRLCISHLMSRDYELVEALWGNAITAISGCLRGFLQAEPGKQLICSDYNAIEARVLAYLAGEQWRLDVFNTHGKIYEMSASKISGVPFEEFERHKKETGSHHHLRKKIGKPAELGSGYSGWVNAWKNFGADKFMTDDEIKEGILKWREASPNIVRFWDGLEEAATRAVLAAMPQNELAELEAWLHSEYNSDDWKSSKTAGELLDKYFPVNRGPAFQCGAIFYQATPECLFCRLPSGRFLHYHQPKIVGKYTAWGTPQLSITFYGVDQKTSQWCQQETYRGKLTNNVVQGFARDILAWAMLRLDAAGYDIVMHVHDEVIAEIPEGFGSVEEFEGIMKQLPPWATGCPINASGGYIDTMYQK